ncbi:MAG TPA: hypothetical protein VN030_07655 [Cellvibrio sp.]|nr:hypothetical protein [Cellvibrio sp.]
MKSTLISIAAVAILLQGCAVGQQRTFLSQAERENIKRVELYNLVIQDEVRPAVEISNVSGAMGGGLIPALIDSSINKGRSVSAQDIIEPLYLATDSLDYRALLAKEVNTSTSSIYTLKEKKDLAEARLLSDPELKEKIKQLSDGEYLLYISSFYGLMENSKSFNSETVAMVFKKPAASASTARPKPIYFNRLNYVSGPVGNGGADSIALWAKNNGEAFTKTLNESAYETAQQLKYDLQNSMEFECGKNVSAEVFGFNGVKMKNASVLVEQKSERAIVRNIGNGALYSIPGTPEAAKSATKKCKSNG